MKAPRNTSPIESVTPRAVYIVVKVQILNRAGSAEYRPGGESVELPANSKVSTKSSKCELTNYFLGTVGPQRSFQL